MFGSLQYYVVILRENYSFQEGILPKIASKNSSKKLISLKKTMNS